MSMLEKFKNAGMSSAKSLVDEPIGQQELRSTLKSIAPGYSGIKSVPLPDLKKAKCLLHKKGLVVPKPGATDDLTLLLLVLMFTL